MMLDDLLNAGAPDQTSGIGGGSPPAVAPVNVQAPAVSSGKSDFNRSAYNNLPDIQMAQQGQQQDPQHTGLFGVKGTLRNVLGILGDAMLVQSGHTPMYGQRIQQEREADAMAGFQSDPRAAAGRLAALPGAADLADKVLNTSATNDLRKQQLESNDFLRRSRAETLTDARDARLRQGLGGILSAASVPDPKTGQVDMQKWNQARNQALKMGSKISDFDESEVPETPDQYNAGYGQTARQVAQGQTSNASIGERANAAEQASKDRRRGQDMTAGSAAQRDTTTRDTAAQRDATARRGQDMRVKKQLHMSGLTVGDQTAPSTNGPSQSDIQYLKSNPHLRAQFDSHFGNGASSKYLGN